jgi:hypothetical protein
MITEVVLSSVRLPLTHAISDAKVLTGRQRPMTEVAFLFAEIRTDDGHDGLGFAYKQTGRRTGPVRPRRRGRPRTDRRRPQRHRPVVDETRLGRRVGGSQRRGHPGHRGDRRGAVASGGDGVVGCFLDDEGAGYSILSAGWATGPRKQGDVAATATGGGTDSRPDQTNPDEEQGCDQLGEDQRHRFPGLPLGTVSCRTGLSRLVMSRGWRPAPPPVQTLRERTVFVERVSRAISSALLTTAFRRTVPVTGSSTSTT